MKLEPVQEAYLRDILDAAQLIRDYTRGLTRETFSVDTKTQDAVLRRFEIIGEASASVDAKTRAHFPKVPFAQMRGMRNIIAHAYGEVDLDIVWNTLQRDLPLLEAALSAGLGRQDSK